MLDVNDFSNLKIGLNWSLYGYQIAFFAEQVEERSQISGMCQSNADSTSIC